MIDPHFRGKKAKRASALITHEVRSLVAEKASSHIGENRRLVANLKELVTTYTIQEWCRQAANSDEVKIQPSDAAAAITSLYLQVAMEDESLQENYIEQMAAIIVPVLRRAIRSTRLDVMGAMPGEKGVAPVVWELIYRPLAHYVLHSLSQMHLSEMDRAKSSRGRPFAWSPLSDHLRAVCDYALLDRLPNYPPNRFLYCTFTRFVIREGYAAVVPVRAYSCEHCRRRVANPTDAQCRICSKPLKEIVRPHCLSIAYLQACRRVSGEDGKFFYLMPTDDETDSEDDS